jgi:H+/gluconate symporter-like permease
LSRADFRTGDLGGAMLEYLGLFAGLALLIALALRGVNIVLASLLAALVVAVSNGLDPFTALARDYSTGPLGAFTFAGRFFLLFVTGAMFGRAMAESQAAASIATALAARLGAHRALWIVVLSCAVLTYGGVVLFVVLFAVLPLGFKLIEQTEIPPRLLAAAVALGVGTFTMTALPGTPSVQNVIAATALGTDLYAGAWLGVVGGTLMFLLGMWYLEWQRKRAGAVTVTANGNAAASSAGTLSGESPHWVRALVPIAVVLGTIVVPKLLLPAAGPDTLSLAGRIAELARAEPVAWPSFALVLGTLSCLVLFRSLRRAPMKLLGRGVDDAIMPLINTAAVIGFGGVVSQTQGFAAFVGFAASVELPPLLSLVFAVNVLAGIVGSASGGLQIFMTSLAPVFVQQDIPLELIHRIGTMASGGLDSLPHSGAVVALLTIMKLSHREAYRDIAVVTVVIPVLVTIVVVAAMQLLA